MSRSIMAAIKEMELRWPRAFEDEPAGPVFILAAGWRSGSTLLQRLVMPSCFIWGEPYGASGIIEGLAGPIRCFGGQWPPDPFFHRGGAADDLAGVWIANLYPGMSDLLSAHRRFFDTLFGEPARRAGARRWGLKEVRLSADHASYLRWLFPRSKFLFLVRNPYDSWRSYAPIEAAGRRWSYRWTDSPVTAEHFGRNWAELAGSFLDHHRELGGMLIRYEDLTRGDLGPIEDYLGLEMDAVALGLTMRGDVPDPATALAEADRLAIGEATGALAARLGYPTPAHP